MLLLLLFVVVCVFVVFVCRISLCGLSGNNVPYVARAIAETLTMSKL
jgi:aspartate/tyrosine/aromatic aminotransferase